MLGYLGGPRLGAFCYNLVHTLIAPAVLALAAWLLAAPLLTQLALILLAHIAADRALGYGLKHASGFKDTHLGRIGRRRLATTLATPLPVPSGEGEGRRGACRSKRCAPMPAE